MKTATEYVELEQAEKIWVQQVNEVRSYINNDWEKGRIASEVAKKARYGDSTISKFARQVGIAPANLYRYMRVHNEITQELKDKFAKILSFCMFEELVKYEVPKAKYEEYLEKAVHEGYSVSEFGRFLSSTLIGTFDEPLKPVVLHFPGELRSKIDKILDLLAKKCNVGKDKDYKKNRDILTGFVVACEDYLERAL